MTGEPLPMAPGPHRVAHRELIPEIPSYAGHIRYMLAPFPRQGRVEIAHRCPNHCPWCHDFGGSNPVVPGGRTGKRPAAVMPLGVIETLLQEIASWPRPLVELTYNNYSELWTHPQWPEALRLVDKYLPKTKFVLVTTGTMLTEKALDEIVAMKTLKHVNFSVNAFFQETYERIHGVSAKPLTWLPARVESLRNRRPDIRVIVSMVYDTTLVTEIERELFASFWSPRAHSVYIAQPSYAGSPLRAPVEPVTLPCRSVFDGLVIIPDGRVLTGCCFDADAELEVGHWPEEKLLDIWKGDKLKAIAETHNSGRRTEIALCKSCTFA